MARRFIIDKKIEIGEKFEVLGEEAKHIMVLRHNVGDKILINDKICEIKEITKQKTVCIATSQAEEQGVPNTKITLFQALLKSDKMEYVIQKAVELGIYKVEPFISKNVVVKLDEKDKVKKVERWNKISLEATKQCGRSDIVDIQAVNSFSDMLDKLKDFDLVIVAYENETNSLKQIIKENLEVSNIAIIIGSEGGFEKREIDEILKIKKSVSISLGKRILRAETASLNLISILMYEFEL